MTSLLRNIVLVLALAFGLTWLLLRGKSPDEARFAEVQSGLDRFTLQEAALRRDVLRERDGLLQTYDPIVVEAAALRQTSGELRSWLGGLPAAGIQADRLVALVARQEDLVEAFKTDNAQLQNSLAYFDLLSFSLGKGRSDPRIASLVGELGTTVLHMTRDPSGDVVALVGRLLAELDGLTAQTQPTDTRESLAVLGRHGRLLMRRLPAMDRGVAQLFELRPDDSVNKLQAEAEKWRSHETGVARQFQIALYLIALLLLAVLVHAGWKLRAGARALQRRAALEHRIAGVSTSFIGCPPDQVGARLTAALGMLAPGFGADRMYLMLADESFGELNWSAPNTASPPAGWPAEAVKLIAASSDLPDLVWHHETASMPLGTLRGALEHAQVAGWAGVVLQHGGHRFGLLAMDRLGGSVDWPFGGMGLLRMAGDVLTHALQSRVAAQERAELRARLLRARRLETIGTFASGIAHNFNNIIAAVIGHAEMAADRLEPRTPAADHVDQIHRAGERARDLVARILDFGTTRRARREAVAVEALLAETLVMLRVALPSGVELEVDSGVAGWVAGDPVQLQQVLANLVRNAGEAIRPPGCVRVSAKRLEAAASLRLSHGTLARGSYVRIDVADDGVGMSAATQAQMFNPFFTTREAGTGLGLATVQAIINDHRGAIDVKSDAGSGTCFAVLLPALASASIPDAVWRGQGQTVLVLGPNQAAVLRDEEMLAALGFEPVGFSSPGAALAASRSSPERFDAMLVEAPTGQDARLVAAPLQAACPGCPVILVVAAGAEPWVGDPVVVGPTLRRPLRSGLLNSALAQCLASREQRMAS